jgi:signal transduction histidine kinase
VLKLRQRLAVIVCLALGVALTAGLWLSISLSRRTMRLMGAVEAVGQGNLGQTLSDSGSDEIAMLCKSFNRMTKDLRQQRLEIGEQAQSIRIQNVQLAEEIRQRIESEEQRSVYEVRLRQAQKLESVGQLAAGIAHEINTPTQFVADNMRFFKDALAELSGMLHLCRELSTEQAGSERAVELADELRSSAKAIDLAFLMEELPTALEDSLGGLDRVATIVGAMRSFSHPGAAEKELVNVNEAIRRTIAMAQNAWRYVAEVETALDPDLPLVPCVQSEFNQVVLSILINAAHAIESAASDGRKGLIRITTAVVEGCAEVRLEDNGQGIPLEIRHRVFDPFFTTKDVGKGTGQGLAISHAVIKRHGGKIEFESAVGRGTTFIIRLPLEAPQLAPV